MSDVSEPIGRVTRCSTQAFSGAVRTSSLGLPAFGACCQAEAEDGRVQVIGVIHDIRIEDDPLARQMATLDDLPAEQLADAQRNRQAPVEFSAITLGYLEAGHFISSLPPQPPFTLAPVYLMEQDALLKFSRDLSFTRQILNAEGVPGNELLAAMLKHMAAAYPAGERERFLLQAGRTIARFLAGDLPRLETILHTLQPGLS